MASANFQKYKTVAEAKAKMMHDATDTRLEHEHGNQEIDKSKTHLNQSCDYADMCELYDNRIAELDSTTNKNKRKDRITLIGLEIPVPENLPRDKYNAWFTSVDALIIAHYGEENVLPAAVHYDEEHEYFHPEKKATVMSRVHGHWAVVPEKDGGLNAKWATGRYNMISINNEIHEMTKRDYGIDFMDGTKRKSNKSVTALKNASKTAELEAREQRVAAYANDIQQWEQRVLKQNSYFEEYRQQKEDQLQEKAEMLNAREVKLDTREDSLNKREKALAAGEADLSARRKEIQLREENTLKIEIQAKKAHSETQGTLAAARHILQGANDNVAAMVAPPELEEFAKKYTRHMAKTELKHGKQVKVRDAEGKPVLEVHNCFDDWKARIAQTQRTNRTVQDLLDQADEMQRRLPDDMDFDFTR